MTFDFGPQVSTDGVLFRIWAPKSHEVKLKIDGKTPIVMESDPSGWHKRYVGGVGKGTRYQFVLDDGLNVPDPASRFQPEDVHGPSEVIDLGAYGWKPSSWKGRPWEECVLYELHIGAFTKEGTFRAAIDRLDHLAELGVTAIQIMPIADFPGRFGWGYDGVLPYAPDSNYGRPEDFMALIEAAHDRSISVFVDVVYNHFGPDGNYLAHYSPLFTERHQTPWGAGINYDGEESKPVREFAIQNALYWITVFRVDGLRLDAVHAIEDDSEKHLLHELTERVRNAAGDRHIHIIAENEENDAALLERRKDGQPLYFTAQWNDDIHHVLHVAATNERFAYYEDYEAEPSQIGRALAEGFVYQGDQMRYRGTPRGKPSAHLPPTAFVSFIQNHDQIGNRAAGDRMASSRAPDALKAIAAVYLLAPQIPMLFMGEEWAAPEPFPYFCDFDEELNQKVREGRKKELSKLPDFDADHALDPTVEATFKAAKLDWGSLSDRSEMLSFYRELLRLRRQEIVPRLKGVDGGIGNYDTQTAHVSVQWRLADGSHLRLAANLTDSAVPNAAINLGHPLFAIGAVIEKELAPWTVGWWLLAPDNSH